MRERESQCVAGWKNEFSWNLFLQRVVTRSCRTFSYYLHMNRTIERNIRSSQAGSAVESQSVINKICIILKTNLEYKVLRRECLVYSRLLAFTHFHRHKCSIHESGVYGLRFTNNLSHKTSVGNPSEAFMARYLHININMQGDKYTRNGQVFSVKRKGRKRNKAIWYISYIYYVSLLFATRNRRDKCPIGL